MKLSRHTMLAIIAPVAVAGGVLVATTSGSTDAQQHVGYAQFLGGNVAEMDAASLLTPLPSPLPSLPDLTGLPTCC
jgi:hypothetical protein